MRKFYIFSIRNELMSLYKDNQENLYKLLNSIYEMKESEFTYAYNLFKQVCSKIDIFVLNNKLYLKMHNDLIYTKLDNEHVINNLYKDEISILKIKKSHLIIESNNSYSTFFSFLNNYDSNFFVCDFESKDFFFLSDIELVVK